MTTGTYRFTFGFLGLADGLNLVVVVMGLFGLGEILSNLSGQEPLPQVRERVSLRSMIPTREDVRRSVGPTGRGSLIGIVTGILPGLGPQVASFVAYAVEKRTSKRPQAFGTGVVEGIAAPEAANNASVQAAFIPTLTLGIPGDAVMAVMMGALMLHGILPGPSLVTDEPELFWGLIASFWVGNVILLVLNIPLIGLWLQVLRIPYRLLFPVIVALVCISVFTLRNSTFDVVMVLVFGLVGYGMTLVRLPAAPLLCSGLVLGPLVEEHLRRALIIGRGDPMVFLESPPSLAALSITPAPDCGRGAPSARVEASNTRTDGREECSHKTKGNRPSPRCSRATAPRSRELGRRSYSPRSRSPIPTPSPPCSRSAAWRTDAGSWATRSDSRPRRCRRPRRSTSRDYGYLFDDLVLEDGAKVPFASFCVPRVEPELTFILKEPLKGPGIGLVDVLRATEWVVPSIEIIDARVTEPRKICRHRG